MSSRKNLFVDLETSGLHYEQGHVILEVGMLLESSADDEHGVVFTQMIAPTQEQWALAHPTALAVNGFTWEELQECGEPHSVVEIMLGNWLLENHVRNTTVIWCGHNAKFDTSFLSHEFGNVLEFVGLFPLANIVDTMSLARDLRRIDKSFNPTSLSGGSISLALGLVPEESLHRAAGGVQAVRQNYYALMKHIKQSKLFV